MFIIIIIIAEWWFSKRKKQSLKNPYGMWSPRARHLQGPSVGIGIFTNIMTLCSPTRLFVFFFFPAHWFSRLVFNIFGLSNVKNRRKEIRKIQQKKVRNGVLSGGEKTIHYAYMQESERFRVVFSSAFPHIIWAGGVELGRFCCVANEGINDYFWVGVLFRERRVIIYYNIEKKSWNTKLRFCRS